MNITIVTGNLGADPDVNENRTACNFRVAENRVRTVDGETVQETEWHRIVALGKQADYLADKLKTGMRVTVSGRLKTRKWVHKDGADRYTTEIIANPFGVEFPAPAQSDAPTGRRARRGLAD